MVLHLLRICASLEQLLEINLWMLLINLAVEDTLDQSSAADVASGCKPSRFFGDELACELTRRTHCDRIALPGKPLANLPDGPGLGRFGRDQHPSPAVSYQRSNQSLSVQGPGS